MLLCLEVMMSYIFDLIDRRDLRTQRQITHTLRSYGLNLAFNLCHPITTFVRFMLFFYLKIYLLKRLSLLKVQFLPLVHSLHTSDAPRGLLECWVM